MMPVGDLVERAEAVDLLDDAAVAVDVEDRRRLALVDRETVGDRPLRCRRCDPARCARSDSRAMLSSRGTAQLDDGVELLAASVEEARRGRAPGRGCAGSRRAGTRPRHPAATSRSRTTALVSSSGTRSPASMIACTCRPSGGAARDVGAEDVTGRDRRDAERLADADALRALAGALGADDQQRTAFAVRRPAVIAGAPRSDAAAAGRRSASPSRDRHRR